MKNVFVLCVLFFSVIRISAQGITFDDLLSWSGTGSKKAMLIVDFNDETQPQCFAWGFRFDGEILTAKDMFNSIMLNDTCLHFEFSGGFLSSISYMNHHGIGGNPFYWTTMSFLSDSWEMNSGPSEIITDGMIYGCTYTDWMETEPGVWSPVFVPQSPVPALPLNMNINESQKKVPVIFPNPVSNELNIAFPYQYYSIEITDLSGRIMLQYTYSNNLNIIDTSELAQGIYLIRLGGEFGVAASYFIKNSN